MTCAVCGRPFVTVRDPDTQAIIGTCCPHVVAHIVGDSVPQFTAGPAWLGRSGLPESPFTVKTGEFVRGAAPEPGGRPNWGARSNVRNESWFRRLLRSRKL